MDDSVIKKTQELLGPFVRAPALSEKLLQKPPLRFLHDVFVAIAKEHGYLSGLFDNEETAWTEAVANDKDAKAFFIAKVINYVSAATGTDFNLKPARVCAGQDAEKTNALLQSLGMILTAKKVDNDAVLREVRHKKGPVDLGAFPKGLSFLKAGDGAKTDKAPSKPPSGAAKSAATKQPSKPAEKAPLRAEPSKPAVSTPVKPTPPAKEEPEVKASKPAPAAKELPTKEVQKKAPEIISVPELPQPEIQPSSQPRPSTATRPTTARPTTAKRAPQRPPTATKSRRGSLARAPSETEIPEDAPPTNIKFLEEETVDASDLLQDLVATDTASFGQLDVNYRTTNGHQMQSEAGHLVANLRDAQKDFIEASGIQEDESVLSTVAQQEVGRFRKEIDEVCATLQKVSRLTDVLSTYLEILPEDFEDMDKDKHRYREEHQALVQKIDAASKIEELELEKLRREQAFQEEALFAVGEEIASAQYRIKEKTELLERLLKLRGVQ